MKFRCLFGHDWRKVGPAYPCHATGCYETYSGCVHNVKVCARCKKWEAYGGHGRLTVISRICEEQLRRMLA